MKLAPRLLALISALAAALMLDALTKLWAERALTLYQPVPVVGEFFRFTLGYNTGVAFSLFADSGSAAALLSGTILFGILGWAVLQLRAGRLPVRMAVPCGLLIGGGLGNFLDRLVDGQVTDFLDFGIGSARWPTFNIADVALNLAIASLFLLSVLASRRSKDRSVMQIQN